MQRPFQTHRICGVGPVYNPLTLQCTMQFFIAVHIGALHILTDRYQTTRVMLVSQMEPTRHLWVNVVSIMYLSTFLHEDFIFVDISRFCCAFQRVSQG